VSDLPTPEQLDEVLKRAPARRRRARWIAAVSIGAAVVVLLGVLATSAGGREERAWKTEPARVEELRVLVTAVGSVEPRHVVDVGSEQSGVVHAVFVDTNDMVTAGQPLAELDTRELSARDREAHASVAALESSLRQARAAARSADDELARVEALLPSGAVGKAEVDRARSQRDQARAARQAAQGQVDAALARLDISETNLRKSVIRSPMDGVVLSRDVEAGQSVVAALQAVTLFQIAADLAEMLVQVDVDEADVVRVKPGQRATFSVPAWPDREFEAQVSKIDLAPTVQGGVVTYRAELAAPNPDGALLVRMTATARIEAERHPSAVTVPLAALRWAPSEVPMDLPPVGAGEGRVWTLVDDAPEPVTVKLGPSDGSRQAVEGLDAGAQLVVGQEGAR
jgi:HlyD family secretion protein